MLVHTGRRAVTDSGRRARDVPLSHGDLGTHGVIQTTTDDTLAIQLCYEPCYELRSRRPAATSGNPRRHTPGRDPAVARRRAAAHGGRTRRTVRREPHGGARDGPTAGPARTRHGEAGPRHGRLRVRRPLDRRPVLTPAATQ